MVINSMKNTRTKFYFLSFLAAAFFLCLSAEKEIYAAAFTVDTLQDNEANGCGTGVCTLREAVTAANGTPEDDTIVFQNGLNGTILLTGSFLNVTGSVTITGPGARNLSVSCNVNRVFIISGASVRVNISGLTITGGNLAGGITNSGNSTLNLSEVALIGNKATTGGGITTRNGAITNITHSIIRNNSASAGAGGVEVVTPGTVTITNSTIAGNTAVNAAGGIGNLGGTVNLTNVTISHNTVTGVGAGAGIANFNAGTVNIRNTISANNTVAGGVPDDASGFSFNTFGGNLIAESRGVLPFGNPNSDNDRIGSSTQPIPIIVNAALGPLQDNGGPTDTYSLMPESQAIDFGNNCVVTATCPAFNPSSALVTDQRGTGFPRRNGKRVDSGAFESVSTTAFKPVFDFDGDAKTDISIFRPAAGEWWINQSSSTQTVAAQFGASTDKPVPADFTGDGKTDIAFWRPSTGEWFILRSEDASFLSFPFGASGDVPLVGDFDGDGKADPSVYRPSTNEWFILKSSGGTIITTFGAAGDLPVAADYDGDGKSDIAIFRPSDGSWWYVRSTDNQFRVFSFGTSSDKPVPGDYTGDGKADIAVFRPSTGEWFFQRSEDNSYYSVPFGQAGDVPVPGDYDGDGRFDTAVFRPSNSHWFVQGTVSGTQIVPFGAAGDTPVPAAFVP
jgi:CSLREA domain-containing protein